MKIARIVTLMMLVLSLTVGLSLALTVSTDNDPKYDFTKIKTFWVKIGTSWGNPLGEPRVVSAVEQSLTTAGWTKAAEESAADAEVILHGSTKQQQSLDTFYTGMGGGWGYGGWGGMGMGTATTTSYTYTEGTLLIDIFDAKSKELIFRGSATDTLSNTTEKNQKKLSKALNKIFLNFPPAPAKKKK
jgi:uncharacterized protein DUF4136